MAESERMITDQLVKTSTTKSSFDVCCVEMPDCAEDWHCPDPPSLSADLTHFDFKFVGRRSVKY